MLPLWSQNLLVFIGYIKESIKEPFKHFPNPTFNEDAPIGYFDGSSHHAYYGAWKIIIVNRFLKYHLWMGYGEGTIKWEEMMALWALLIFTSNKNILSLQVFGHSKVIVDGIFAKENLKFSCLNL